MPECNIHWEISISVRSNIKSCDLPRHAHQENLFWDHCVLTTGFEELKLVRGDRIWFFLGEVDKAPVILPCLGRC